MVHHDHSLHSATHQWCTVSINNPLGGGAVKPDKVSLPKISESRQLAVSTEVKLMLSFPAQPSTLEGDAAQDTGRLRAKLAEQANGDGAVNDGNNDINEESERW